MLHAHRHTSQHAGGGLDERLDRSKSLAAIVGLLAPAMGGAVLVGWAIDLAPLKGLVPGAISIEPALALGFVTSGVAVSLGARVGDSGVVRVAIAGAALSTLVLSALCFVNGIAPYPAACLALISVGLVTMKTRAASVSSALGVLVATAAVFGLVGYAAGATGPTIEAAGEMAITSATALIFLGAALVLSQPSIGPMPLLLSDGIGGALARRIVPLAVAGVVVLATLRVVGEKAGLFGTDEGVWLFTCMSLLLIVPIIWRATLLVELADRERGAVLARLEELAESDPLTGLYNRRRVDKEMTDRLAGIQRYGGWLSVLVVDLDGFKDANDSFGHACGDAILTAVATTLREHVRASDVVGRFGGDEFVVLLPEATSEAAVDVGDKLRRVIARLEVPAPITASIGGVACEASIASDFTPDGLLTLADKELYRAKAAGRNRLSVKRLETPSYLRQAM